MLELSEMLIRFFVALGLGALIGFEREVVGKEAGIRTAMLVAGGASIFAMISIIVPYIAQVPPEEIKNTLPDRVLSNIVVGIGFLGAGIIIKTGEHVRGLTTAAIIWFTAAIGTLAGLGFFDLAAISAISASSILLILRKLDIYKFVRPNSKPIGNEKQVLD